MCGLVLLYMMPTPHCLHGAFCLATARQGLYDRPMTVTRKPYKQHLEKATASDSLPCFHPACCYIHRLQWTCCYTVVGTVAVFVSYAAAQADTAAVNVQCFSLISIVLASKPSC